MIMYAEIFIIRIFVDSRLIFQVISGFSQHEKDAHRNLAPIGGRTSSQSLFWTLFVKKRISYEYVKTMVKAVCPGKTIFVNSYPLL